MCTFNNNSTALCVNRKTLRSSVVTGKGKYMQNNNNNQAPQGVPDHRLEQMMERMRQLELQNTQLRATVDHMSKPQQQQPAKESKFNPEVEAALREFVQQQMNPLQEELKNQVGYLHDRNDEANFRLKYSGERYEKFVPQIERIRQEQLAQGRWISREDALKHVYFEETGKKPAEAPPVVQEKPPVWSPYFNTYVDPNTNLPLSPDKVAELTAPKAPETQAPQTQQMQPQQQYDTPAWQQPPQQPQQQPQQQPWQPAPTGFGQRQQVQSAHGSLPQQSVYGQAPAQQRATPIELSLESSDAQLEAFEKQFGDIPL